MSDAPTRPLFRFLPWLLVAGIAVVQLRALPGDYLGRESDDALYVLTSLGLVRGEYRMSISPGNPPQTIIAPGYPLLLAPAAALAGNSLGIFHLAAWIFLAVCDGLVWLWIRRRLPRAEAMVCLVLFGLNPLILARAGKVMTEIPFLAMTLGLFLLLENPAWPGWGSGLWLAYAWLIREPAVALFPVPIAWHWFRRKDARGALAAAAIPLASMAAWSLWLAKANTRMKEIDELGWAFGGGILTEAASTVRSNISYYTGLWGRLWLPVYPAARGWELGAGACLAVLSAFGAWRILRRRAWEPAVLWLISGAVLHVVWPYQYERYLAAFIPMLIWTLWEGVAGLGVLETLRMAGFSIILAGQFWGQSRYLLGPSAGRSVPELNETYVWIRGHIPEHAAIASIWYMRDALYGGHPFAPLPTPAPTPELRRWFLDHRIGYVLLQDPGDAGFTAGPRAKPLVAIERLRKVLSGPPFEAVYRNVAEGTVVIKVNPD